MYDSFGWCSVAVDGIEDGGGWLGPDEGLRSIVMLGDGAVDRSLKVDDPAEAATFQPAPRQGGEEALDRVHPRGRGRGEVEDPAWVPSQPGPHLRVFVCAVVVQDYVDQFAGRHRRLDRVEEAQELLVAVTLHASPDHRAL